MFSGFAVAIDTAVAFPLFVFNCKSPLIAAAGIKTFISVEFCDSNPTASSTPGNVTSVTKSILVPFKVIISPPRKFTAGTATTFEGVATTTVATTTFTSEAGSTVTSPSETLSGNVKVSSSPSEEAVIVNSTSSPFGICTFFTKSKFLPETRMISPGFLSTRSSGASTDGKVTSSSSSV